MIRLNSFDPGRSLAGPGYSAESQWMQPAESFRIDLPSGGPEVRSHHSFTRIWPSERAFKGLTIPEDTCDRTMTGWLFRQGAKAWLLQQNQLAVVSGTLPRGRCASMQRSPFRRSALNSFAVQSPDHDAARFFLMQPRLMQPSFTQRCPSF